MDDKSLHRAILGGDVDGLLDHGCLRPGTANFGLAFHASGAPARAPGLRLNCRDGCLRDLPFTLMRRAKFCIMVMVGWLCPGLGIGKTSVENGRGHRDRGRRRDFDEGDFGGGGGGRDYGGGGGARLRRVGAAVQLGAAVRGAAFGAAGSGGGEVVPRRPRVRLCRAGGRFGRRVPACERLGADRGAAGRDRRDAGGPGGAGPARPAGDRGAERRQARRLPRAVGGPFWGCARAGAAAATTSRWRRARRSRARSSGTTR